MNSIKFFATIIFLSLAAACKTDKGIQPQRKNIVDAVFASGSIATKNEYNVTAYMDGYLKASFVTEGDSVHKGETLFKLLNDVQQTQVNNALINYRFAQNNNSANAPKIQQLESQILQAKETLITDSINFVRYAKLIKTKAVAQADYDKAALDFKNAQYNLSIQEQSLADLRRSLSLDVENSKSQLDQQNQNNGYYNLDAESSGRIMQVFKKDGDLLKKGDAIAQVGTGSIIAKLLIAEDDIKRVQLQQKTYISLNSDKDKLYSAVITKIYPAFDQNTQSFTVEATFDTIPPYIKDGTQLQANIIIEEKSYALVIPSQYLLNGDSVILKSEKKKIPVQTGIKTMEWTEVSGGVSDKDILLLPKQ